MFRSSLIITFVAALSLTLGSADHASAKNKKKNKGGASSSLQGNSGKKAVPPGQIKRYTRGAKLPGDVKYNSISDLSKWKMKPLGAGEKYIRVGDEVLRVSDTMKVLAIVGLVSELAN